MLFMSWKYPMIPNWPGRITGVFSTDEVSQDLILECATKFESKLDRTVKAQEPVRKCVETGGKHE